RDRGTQRQLAADGQEYVDLARGERAIVFFITFDIRRLDILEGEVAPFLKTEFGHSLEEIGVEGRLARLDADIAEPQRRSLLRARRKRPGGRGAGEEGDEHAACHCHGRAARSVCSLSHSSRTHVSPRWKLIDDVS